MIKEARLLRQLIACHQEDLRDRLSRRGDNWSVYGRDFYSYLDDDFFNLTNFNEIYTLLRPKTEPVIVDLMASTEAVASLLDELPHQKKSGIAVALSDDRNKFQKQRDDFLGIQQVTGDLMESKTWIKLKKALNGKKADLIIEAGIAGLDTMPKSPQFYGLILNRTWNLLSENGGMLLAEIPPAHTLAALGIDMSAWKSALDTANIAHKYDAANNISSGFLKLIKTPSSPLNLPIAA